MGRGEVEVYGGGLGGTRPRICATFSPPAHLDAAALHHLEGEPHPRVARRSPSSHPAGVLRCCTKTPPHVHGLHRACAGRARHGPQKARPPPRRVRCAECSLACHLTRRLSLCPPPPGSAVAPLPWPTSRRRQPQDAGRNDGIRSGLEATWPKLTRKMTVSSARISTRTRSYGITNSL
jgi:hypothetical protein